MNIIKNNGFVKYRNCRERAEKVKYIVIHYTGAEGTAENNVAYFNGGNRGASAHYFVGRDGAICEYCDPVKWYAWHCGGSIESSHHPYYGKCTNANSIGIEICTHNNGSSWEFTAKAVAAAVELTKYLMKQFGVPAENVIRHYDVTGKSCPRVPGWGAVGGDAEWKKFKKNIGSATPATATTTAANTTEKKFYRVRKTWADADSQVGAYLVLDNAIAEANNAGSKYAVFDWEGKEIYRYSEGSGTKEKEIRFYYPGYKRRSSPDDRQGAGCIWHDQHKNCLVVDSYFKNTEASNKLIKYLLNNGLYNINIVGTHAHGDHLGGFFKILESYPMITIEHFYCYDPASLKLAGNGSSNAKSAQEDKEYLQNLISKVKAKGGKVHYVKTGDTISCGEMTFEVNRHQPTSWSEYDTGEAWAYLNDGSVCLYNRPCHVLLVGDASGEDAIDDCGDIDVVEAGHHGNNGHRTLAEKYKKKGVGLAIECNNEANGPGSYSWTKYGAGRLREVGITVWMLNADIKGVVKGGKMTVSHGSATKVFDVPFGKVFYRVRKTWADAKSQIGAYTVLDKAKECVDDHPGYHVYDETGKQIYPAATTTTTTTSATTEPQTNQEKFIAKIGLMVKADMAKTGILACITMAQAILESGWGKSELAVNANNLFGMKKSLSGNTWSGSTWKGKTYSKTTKEVYASGPATVQADFRAYDSWQDSVNDHSAYLAGAKNGSTLRYKGLVGCTGYKKAAQIIKDGGYATAPDYVSKLCKLIEQYDLTKYNTTYKPASSASTAITTTTTVATKNDGLFRVRKTWDDAKSQVGAYHNPRNGIAKVEEMGEGYELYDDQGEAIYPGSYRSGYFRIRKTWKNIDSQISAHKYIEVALDFADTHPGYNVYDNKGRKIYPV